MVEVRASRIAAETLGDEGTVAGVNRHDVQVAADYSETVEIRSSRLAIEVLSPEVPTQALSRQDIQVAADYSETVEMRSSRFAMEVLGASPAKSAVNRQDIQVAGDYSETVEIRCTRFVGEALARQGSAGPVIPIALVDDAFVFLHNWATQARMRTSFRTSVVSSPDSGAESRRGLGLKPFRTLDLEWMICDGMTLERLERLEVLLRRMTDQRFQVPLYMDQQELADAYITTDTTINVPTDKARFFQGARVAIVQLDLDDQPVSHTFHIIESMTNASLTFDAPLGVDIAAGSYLFPMMDCEVTLEASANYTTARVPVVKLSLAEVPGASQLPPLKSDHPSGAPAAHDGRPIWFEEPDWSNGIIKGRKRQGSRNSDGRADFVSVEADRSRQTHKFVISGTRDDMWSALEFFETRRGRLRSFWHIDQDQYYTGVDIDISGGFVSVSEIGDIDDLIEETEAIGLVMSDGTHIVRDVSSILAVTTVFRISVATALPAGLLVTDLHRVARARLVRFATDEFTETWTHTGLMSAGINVIEVLNEEDFPFI